MDKIRHPSDSEKKDMRSLGSSLILGIPDVLPQRIAKYWNGNCAELHKKLREMLNDVPLEYCFENVGVFRIQVPEDYEYGICLSSLRKKYQKNEKFYFNEMIDDCNFSEASNIIIPGRILVVKVFCQTTTRLVSHDEHLTFLKSKNGVLLGAQGAALVFDHGRDNLLEKFAYASLDKKSSLYKAPDGQRKVPCLHNLNNSDWQFDLHDFNLGCYDGVCLLHFSYLEYNFV